MSCSDIIHRPGKGMAMIICMLVFGWFMFNVVRAPRDPIIRSVYDLLEGGVIGVGSGVMPDPVPATVVRGPVRRR